MSQALDVSKKVVRGRRILSLCLGFVLLAQTLGFSFVYQLVIPEKSTIAKLSNEQLINSYLDVLVELEAAKTFHQTSGFRPADYEKYKALIRYRLDLLMEIQKRKLEAPKFEQ